jgi:DNA repair protein RadC
MANENNVEQFMVPLYRMELVRDGVANYRSANGELAAAEIFHEMLDKSPVEKIAVIHCNSGDQMIGAEVVAMGSHEMVTAQMKDLLRGALINNAASIWVAHNHVDGYVKASLPDYTFTLLVEDACRIMHMRFNDHLVIGPNNEHYSIMAHARELEAELLRETIFRRVKSIASGDKFAELEGFDIFGALPPAPAALPPKSLGGKKR